MPDRQAEHLPCGVNLHRFRLLRCTLDFHFGSKAEVTAPQTRCIPAWNPATSAATTGKHFEGDTVFGLHCTAGTVRGWRRPMANTQIAPTTAVAAIGIMASGKLPVSAWIQPTR